VRVGVQVACAACPCGATDDPSAAARVTSARYIKPRATARQPARQSRGMTQFAPANRLAALCNPMAWVAAYARVQQRANRPFAASPGTPKCNPSHLTAAAQRTCGKTEDKALARVHNRAENAASAALACAPVSSRPTPRSRERCPAPGDSWHDCGIREGCRIAAEAAFRATLRSHPASCSIQQLGAWAGAGTRPTFSHTCARCCAADAASWCEQERRERRTWKPDQLSEAVLLRFVLQPHTA
jgi:hypothetical protein